MQAVWLGTVDPSWQGKTHKVTQPVRRRSFGVRDILFFHIFRFLFVVHEPLFHCHVTPLIVWRPFYL
jgi:hypothetical protein